MHRESVPDTAVANLLVRLSDLLTPQVFWDIGANFGYYTWLLKSHRPTLDIVMLEPDVGNRALVEATLSRGDLAGVTLLPFAASDFDGETGFGRDSSTGARGTIKQSSEGGESVPVEARRLDALVGSGPAHLIKIDVEGHEHQVLAGCSRLLARDRPFVVFECECPLKGKDASLEASAYTVVDVETLEHAGPLARNFLACPNERLDILDAIRACFGEQGAPLA